jgi:transposase InsO family protein
MATHLRTELVVDALEMALWRRNPDVGLIYHTDRGVQYTALSFGKRLEEAGIGSVCGSSRLGPGQRYLGELRGEFEVRTPPRASISRPRGCQDGRLRLHRRFLQPGSTALITWLLEPL